MNAVQSMVCSSCLEKRNSIGATVNQLLGRDSIVDLHSAINALKDNKGCVTCISKLESIYNSAMKRLYD